ncbi:MAG: hypothetical protein VXX85_03765 [Candidatus Margulisiibacteriota bacterium]|nr:hypothetical protein [Candidatus Margulisiibacteriota bacterium]
MNVTNERTPGRVATFQDKIHHLPPKLPTSDCCPAPNSTDTVNQANITLEELASDSSILSEPNYRYEVQGVSLNQVSKKNLFPLHTSTCCSDCRASQISSNFTPTNFDPHGNSNNSSGAPLSFSGVNPPVLEEFEKEFKMEFKPIPVATAIQKEPEVKQSCCVIS